MPDFKRFVFGSAAAMAIACSPSVLIACGVEVIARFLCSRAGGAHPTS